jgi:hypothetical protein
MQIGWNQEQLMKSRTCCSFLTRVKFIRLLFCACVNIWHIQRQQRFWFSAEIRVLSVSMCCEYLVQLFHHMTKKLSVWRLRKRDMQHIYGLTLSRCIIVVKMCRCVFVYMSSSQKKKLRNIGGDLSKLGNRSTWFTAVVSVYWLQSTFWFVNRVCCFLCECIFISLVFLLCWYLVSAVT